MYYTYVLKSLKDDKLYIGHTENIKNRFERHLNGQVIATRNRRPLKLIYFEGCLNFEKSIKREKYFKTEFGRRYLKNRL